MTQTSQRPLLDSVPSDHPLAEACALGDCAATVGFDWPDAHGALDKVVEEAAELREWVDSQESVIDERVRRQEAESELGDLLFAVCMVARKMSLSPEDALAQANQKFRARFASIERALWQMGTSPADATLDEMEAAWQAAKSTESRTR